MSMSNLTSKLTSNLTDIVDELFQMPNITASSNSTSEPRLPLSMAGQGLIYKLLCFASVIFVGIVGSCANSVVLGAFLSTKQKSKTINKLMVNQIGLDLFASVSIVLSYSAKINDYFYVYPDTTASAVLCKLIANGVFPFWSLTSSITGLVVLTLERYF